MAKRKPPEPTPPTTTEIWRLWNVLLGRDGNRQSQYLQTMTSLGLDITNPAYTFYMEVDNREKMWWESEDQDRDEFVKIDRLAQIIEDQRTYLGTMRSVRAPIGPPELWGGSSDPLEVASGQMVTPMPGMPTPPDAHDKASAYADMVEKMVLDLWREWSMVRQYALLGFFAVTLGSAIGTLEFSDRRGIPIFRTRSPYGFYGVQKSDDDTRLEQALFVTYQPGASLALQYPEQCGHLSLTQRVYVADYFDEGFRIRTAQGVEEPLALARNPLGHVPVYVFPNIIMPGLFGTTMLPRALPMQNELDRLFTQEAMMITDAVNAPTVIASDTPDLIPAGWTWGKNAVAQISSNGKLGKATLDVLDHQMFQGRISMIMQMLDSTMDFSGISRGSFEGSSLTAKGVNSLLSPNAGRMDIKLQVMNEVMERCTEDALRMWYLKATAPKAPDLSKAAYGAQKKHSFSMMADPKKLNPKWLRVEVFVDSSSRVDQQAEQVTTIQKVRGTPQLMSAETAMELDPNINNVGEEQRRIDTEAQKLAASQVAISQATQQMQMPPTITSAEENYAGERGGAMPGATPLSVTPGPAPGGPQAGPGGAPQPPAPGGPNPLVQQLQAIFADPSLKLKGQVLLCADSANGDLVHGLQLYVSDTHDKQTILNYFHNDDVLKTIHDQHGVKWEPAPTPNAIPLDPASVQEGMSGPPGASGPTPGPPGPGGQNGQSPDLSQMMSQGPGGNIPTGGP